MDLGIWNVWQSGGWVMLPLFALALVLYTQALSLLLQLRAAGIEEGDEREGWTWVRAPERAKGLAGEIIRYTNGDRLSAEGIRSRFDEVRASLLPEVDRRVTFLGTLVAAAPLFGLLGTVLGMLRTFIGISAGSGAETAAVVATGISEALVTTQTGLMIALPGVFLVMSIQRRRRALDVEIGRLESLSLSALSRGSGVARKPRPRSEGRAIRPQPAVGPGRNIAASGPVLAAS